MNEVRKLCSALIGTIVLKCPKCPEKEPDEFSSGKEALRYQFIGDIQVKLAEIVYWIKEFEKDQVELDFVKQACLVLGLCARTKVLYATQTKSFEKEMIRNVSDICDECYDVAKHISKLTWRPLSVTKEESKNGLKKSITYFSDRREYGKKLEEIQGRVISMNMTHDEDILKEIIEGIVESRKQIDNSYKPSPEQIYGGNNERVVNKMKEAFK